LSKSSLDISTEVNNCFEELFHDLSEGDENRVVLSHFGEFSQDLVNSISEGVENKLLENVVKKTIVKRMFSILIEGLQNIRLHGAKFNGKSQHGHVIVAKNNDVFNVSFGNYVMKSNLQKLSTYLDEINELDNAKIKERYLEVLGNGLISEKGGAGLGFITIAMKSKSKIKYNYRDVDDELVYFHYQVKLDF
jgi:hypothetical protein